jgi:D-alanine transaminase
MQTHNEIVYFNGRFLPKKEVRISPDDRGFLFADGVYEVILSYGGRLFKPEDHIKRMERGLQELRINCPETEKLKDIAEAMIQKNNFGNNDAKIYIQITRGAAPRTHAFPDPPVSPTIYAAASAFQLSQEKWEHGAKVILVPDIRWARCDIKSVGLLPNTLAFQQAKEQGADEAIFVRDGVITEGAHTNFCAVFHGEIITFPKTHYILAGITRNVVLDLCRELSIPVKEFPFFEHDLTKADECMIIGTTTEIMPVIQVNDWKVGNGKLGPITVKLQQAFRELVRDA